MRARRQFQPMLDVMPIRIAPSAIQLAAATAPAVSTASVPVATSAQSSSSTQTPYLAAVATDSDGVEADDPTPIILNPIPPGPPTSLPC